MTDTDKEKQRSKPVEHTRILSGGTIVRIESPHGDHRHARVIIAPELIPGTGFVQFLREHAIVGLAVGFVIATQVQSLVKLLVDSFLNPFTQLLFGSTLTSHSFHLTFHGRTVPFNWGKFAYGFLDFLFVLLTVYVLVSMLKLEKLDKPKKKEVEADGPPLKSKQTSDAAFEKAREKDSDEDEERGAKDE